jgi:V8-like Glu-specific endopeptidase
VIIAAASAMLLLASGATAAADPRTGDFVGSWSGDVVVHDAALSAQQQQAATDYWTPERMAAAVPIEQLAGDLVDRLPAVGQPTVGKPFEVAPVAGAADPQDATPMAFPFGGGPWTGGGAVTQTAGRVFFNFQGQASSCSGNAVTSANGSTVMTAGHCIKLQGSFHTNWVFVPGFNNGNDPFGTWPAAQTFVTPQWNANENINFDIGAAVVGQVGGQRLTDVVGGQGIAFNQPRGLAMYAFGYPAAPPYDGSRLIYCSGNTFNDFLLSTGIGMTCNMTGGSSGGPWFRSFSEATGTGLQNSVNSFRYNFFPWMFGPYFGAEGQAVYNTAQSA